MAKEQTQKRSVKRGLVGWALIIGSGIAIFNSGVFSLPESDNRRIAEPRPEKTYAEMCTIKRYGSYAVVMMQTVVKQRLNDPRSARFPNPYDGLSVDSSTCTFTVSGEYSAKNGFGGRVRGYYSMKFRRSE